MKRLQLTILLSIFFILTLFFGTYAADNELLDRGLSYYQNQEFVLASAHFEEAKKIDPQNSKIYFYLGNTYYQLNELDSAIVNYTQGLDYTDKKGHFFFNLGNCYFLKENYEFASEMYSQAALYDSTIYDSYLNAGNAYYNTGDYAKTIIQWETYLEKNPTTPQYKNIEKAIAYLREELERSIKDLEGTDKETGLDEDLLEDVLKDLNGLLNRTRNVLETSEKPIDDLTSEGIER
ncbi:MAG: tetratricopeptide repeat protein [Spirochaetota bacterium]|nr:MAG: tetratricopeptide repeat protein [Spirochaetota bacterium]